MEKSLLYAFMQCSAVKSQNGRKIQNTKKIQFVLNWISAAEQSVELPNDICSLPIDVSCHPSQPTAARPGRRTQLLRDITAPRQPRWHRKLLVVAVVWYAKVRQHQRKLYGDNIASTTAYDYPSHFG